MTNEIVGPPEGFWDYFEASVNPASENLGDDNDCEVLYLELIEDGEYVVLYDSYRTVQVQGGGKLVITFIVCDGPDDGTQLEAYYPIELRGPPGEHGRFQIGRAHV